MPNKPIPPSVQKDIRSYFVKQRAVFETDSEALKETFTAFPGYSEPTVRKYALKRNAKQKPAPLPTDAVKLLLDRLDRLEDMVSSPFIHTRSREPKVELSKDVTTEFFISDIHFHPEHNQGHDPAAWEVTRKALEIMQPEIVVLGGDINDFYAPSRYEKIPRLATPEAFKGEVEYGKRKRLEIRETVPDARIIEIRSNHHDRIKKNVHSNAPWLAGFIDDLFYHSDHELGIEYVEDDYQIGKLRHAHGDRHAGSGRVNTAKAKFERLLYNIIFGHHHKFSSWFQRRHEEGGYYGAWGNGCLQWLSAEYASKPDWTQGFSVVQYTKQGNFAVDQILIHKPSTWSPMAEAVLYGNHIKVDMR